MASIKINTLIDTFDGAVLDPAVWLGSATLVGGAAHVDDNTYIESPFDGETNPSATWLDISDSWVVIEASSWSVNAYLALQDRDSYFSAITNGFINMGLDGAGNLSGSIGDDAGGPVATNAVVFDSMAMRWWRLRETAGVAYCEYSADGMSWTTLTSFSSAGIALFNVGEGILQIGSSGAGHLVLEGVNTNIEPHVITFPLSIAPEGVYTDAERNLIDNEPPGLFPGDQNSYWGQVRKVLGAKLQDFNDTLAQWYLNLNPGTVNEADMHNWERQFGIPISSTDKTLEQRRAFVEQRFQKGSFTRTRRRLVVESFIVATFGVAPTFDSFGIPFDAGGIPFFSDITDLAGTYNIVEDIPNFTYDVRILDTIDIDEDGLRRELDRITPAGIEYTITMTPTP